MRVKAGRLSFKILETGSEASGIAASARLGWLCTDLKTCYFAACNRVSMHCLRPTRLGRSDAPDVKALDLRQYVFVGHSLEGEFARYLTSEQASGVEGLVLVAPAPQTAESSGTCKARAIQNLVLGLLKL